MGAATTSIRLTAVLVANQIDIKGIKSHLDIRPIVDSSTELMFALGDNRYQFFFNYGVIVFARHSDDDIKIAIRAVENCLKSPASNWIREEISLEHDPEADMEMAYDRVVVNHLDAQVFRIVMLNLAQSIALDHYNSTSEHLLDEVKGFTRELELRGRLSMGRTSMMKFIGKALGTKNDITDNIYIFDAPEMVWDNEFLDKLNLNLRRHYDLKVRTNEIDFTLKTISENLDTFREIYNQRENSRLELIIITLILVEVIDLLVTRLLSP